MDPVPFNDWRLVALTPLPPWALVVLGLLALGAVGAASLALRGEVRRRRRAVLVGLRVVAAVLAFVLVLEPGVELLATTPIRGRVAVLVDDSRSMDLPASPGGPSRAHVAAAAVRDGDRAGLEDRFQVEYYAFAEGVTPTDPEGIVAAAQKEDHRRERDQTFILPALEEVARAGGGRPLSGIVLLSDGADNGGLEEALRDGPKSARAKAVRERLAALGAPVFTFDVAGDRLKDLAIAEVRVDGFAFVRNSVEVEVVLAQRGFSTLDVPVVLEREGQVVATTQAKVGEDRPVKVELPFVPDTTGEFVYTVRVPVQDGESVTANNTRSFVLKVIRDRVRVLHVAGRPSYDERFLRMLLKRDPNVDLISFFILRTPSDLHVASDDELSLIPFPTDEIFHQQIKTFDLVVFHNFTYRPYRMSRYLRGIADYVRDGGAFLMLGGENSFSEGHYAGTPIEEILPVTLDRRPMAPSAEAFPARLTPHGRRHPVTELAPGEAQNEAAWSRLPTLRGINRTRAREGAQVLLEHPRLQEGGSGLPVVAVQDVGRGRAMAITADSSWMWAFLPAREGRVQRAYDSFFQQAIRWLVRDPELTQVRLQVERERFTPGEPVGLLVKARTRDYGPAAGARASVSIREARQGETVRSLEGIVSADGTLRLESPPLVPGPYRATVSVRGDSEEIGSADAVFVVEESGPELARPAPRPDLLRFVADATGGEHRPVSALRLSRLPIKDSRHVEIGRRKTRPLWDRLPVLFALCAVLGGEWFLRRRWGYF